MFAQLYMILFILVFMFLSRFRNCVSLGHILFLTRFSSRHLSLATLSTMVKVLLINGFPKDHRESVGKIGTSTYILSKIRMVVEPPHASHSLRCIHR